MTISSEKLTNFAAMTIKHTLNRIPRWLTTALVVAAILYATLASHPVGADKMPLFPGVDKVVHFIMFATLAAALLFDLSRTKNAAPAGRLMAWAGTAAIVFGAVDELMQHWLTTERSGDPVDWLADTGGVATVLLIFGAWQRRRRRGDHRPACRD